MTQNQELHLQAIQAGIVEKLDIKYRAGQQKHGGNLWERCNPLRELSHEITDAVAYLHDLEIRDVQFSRRVHGLIELLGNPTDENIRFAKTSLGEMLAEMAK